MTDHYYSSVAGRAVQRFGTSTFLGCTRDAGGYHWQPERIVCVPEHEYTAHVKSYRSAVRNGDLLERTADEYALYIEGASLPASTSVVDAESSASAASTQSPSAGKKARVGRNPERSNS